MHWQSIYMTETFSCCETCAKSFKDTLKNSVTVDRSMIQEPCDIYVNTYAIRSSHKGYNAKETPNVSFRPCKNESGLFIKFRLTNDSRRALLKFLEQYDNNTSANP